MISPVEGSKQPLIGTGHWSGLSVLEEMLEQPSGSRPLEDCVGDVINGGRERFLNLCSLCIHRPPEKR